jgi:hypothetical protein
MESLLHIVIDYVTMSGDERVTINISRVVQLDKCGKIDDSMWTLFKELPWHDTRKKMHPLFVETLKAYNTQMRYVNEARVRNVYEWMFDMLI